MVQTVSGVKQNIWRWQQSSLYAPVRRKFSIDGLVLYLPLYEPSQTSLLNGTGIATEAPLALGLAQTFNVTQAGTFLIYLQAGQTGTATSGTMTVTGSPVSLVGGLNTITTTGAVGTFTVAVPTIISKDLNASVSTVVGAVKVLQGWAFDQDDFISVADSAALDIGTSDFTILCWRKVDSRANINFNQMFIDKRVATSPYQGYAFYLWCISADANSAKTLRAQVNTAAAQLDRPVIHSVSLYDNTYHLFGFSCDRDSATGGVFSVDGVQIGTGQNFSAQTATIANAIAPRIGRDCVSETDYSFGRQGEEWLYSRVLTLLEILAIHRATKWRYS